MFKKANIIIILCMLNGANLQPCALSSAKDIAQKIANSQALYGLLHGAVGVAASCAIGYASGGLAPKSVVQVSPHLAGVFGATYAGAISACTIAPCMAYKKGKLPGLLAYGVSLACIVYSDYYFTNKKQREFAISEITYHSAYSAELITHGSPKTLSTEPCETCPLELCYPLAKILLAENLAQ